MKEEVRIQEQKLLYHLTDLDNLESILKKGLMSRYELNGKFKDVADPDILEGREKYDLHKMVPFHFFAKNPFDGRVLADHPHESFCLISVYRSFAKSRKWEIIPKHPLSKASAFEICDYESGFEKIDWKKMNKREYSDPDCKSVCMAECLSPSTVDAKDFRIIYVKSEQEHKLVTKLIKRHNLDTIVTINPKMLTIKR